MLARQRPGCFRQVCLPCPHRDSFKKASLVMSGAFRVHGVTPWQKPTVVVTKGGFLWGACLRTGSYFAVTASAAMPWPKNRDTWAQVMETNKGARSRLYVLERPTPSKTLMMKPRKSNRRFCVIWFFDCSLRLGLPIQLQVPYHLEQEDGDIADTIPPLVETLGR